MKTELILLALVVVALLEGVDSHGCPRIVSRAQWGARPPKPTAPLSRPVPKVFIHHTATGRCTTQASCSQIVKRIQKIDMDTRGWVDIQYHFLVGEDGNVYEGRGWNYQGARVRDWATEAYGIGFLGDFTTNRPNAAAVSAAQKLIACGRSANNIRAGYTLHGHRDDIKIACPGNTLYNIIKGWKNFAGKIP